MKVLLLHNYYGSKMPSGENQAFDLEHKLLKSRGHHVESLTRNSDEILSLGRWGAIVGGVCTPWNPFAGRAVRQRVRQFEPKVVHAHNTFPLLSPSVFPAVGTLAARVLTLHNYRLFCPAAIPLRDGHPCTLCLDKRSVLPSIAHACYRQSRWATLPLAANVALTRAMSLWLRHVDAFIALTEFQRDVMVSAGLPSGRVFVKPNFFPGVPLVVPWKQRRKSVVFVGRISEEKGLCYLLDAWAKWGSGAPELRVIGDGPLREPLAAKARDAGVQVKFLGQLAPADAAAEIGSACLLVMPSIWFEGFPMVLREAFAFGTAVAVSRIGSLPGIVDQGKAGLIFQPADSISLLGVIREAWETEGRLECLGESARYKYIAEYGEDRNYAALMKIYDVAIESCMRRQR